MNIPVFYLVLFVFAVILLIITLFIFLYPIELGVKFQRFFLQLSGLKKNKIKTSHGQLNYFQGGKGPVMILVHGFIAEAGNWYPVVSSLKKKYTLVIPDLPGHGESDPLTDKLSPGDLLEGILNLVQQKSEFQKVILVGNSLGGWVSMMVSLQIPERIAALILENSAGLKTSLPERLLLPKDIKSARELYQMILGDAPGLPDFLYKDLIKYLSKDRYVALYHSLSDEYFLDSKLEVLTMPVYLFWGARDRLFDLEYAKRLNKEIPGSSLIVTESAGHAIHFTHPGTFLENLEILLN